MRRTIFVFFILILLFSAVMIAWADYIPPNRRIRVPERDFWIGSKEGYPDCGPVKTATGCDGPPPNQNWQLANCLGGIMDSWVCTPGYIYLDPATVSGSFSCPSPGSGGWCLGGGALILSASEPLSGHVITNIEGDPGGTFCAPPNAASCTWGGGGQGNYSINFWAHSSYGDTSYMSSANWRQDTVPPTVGLTVTGGTVGGGGWYRNGPLALSANGSDATSGFAGGTVSITSISVDGVYGVDIQGSDNAGNMGFGSATVRYDNTPPTLAPSFSGTPGSSGWYRSDGTDVPNAADALSGVGTVEYQLDGGGWQSGTTAAVSGEGSHTMEWRVFDVAGNQATDSRAILIDSIAPTSTFVTPAEGSELWVSGTLAMRGTSSDATSGLASAEIYLNSGAGWLPLPMSSGNWSYSWNTQSVPNGTYIVQVRARDIAGNLEATARITVHVDNIAPGVNIPATWFVWESVRLSVWDQGIGINSAKLTIDGGLLGTRKYNWNAESIPGSFRWDRRFGSSAAPPGEYNVTLEAWDRVGNRGADSGKIIVPVPPTDSPAAAAPAVPAPSATATEAEVETSPPTTEPTQELQPGQPATSPPTTTATPQEVAMLPLTGPTTQESSVVAPVPSLPISGILGAAGTIGLLFAVGGSYVLDRRHEAVKRLTQRLEEIGSTLKETDEYLKNR